MELTTKEQAEAFVFFMESERLRHFKDIDQIDKTLNKICRAWEISRIILDPNKDYWVDVDKGPKISLGQPAMQELFHGTVDYQVLDDDTGHPD